MVAAWGLRLPGIRGRFDEFLITGCTLTGQEDVVRHTDKATHEFLMFRVHPDTPIDFTESLFVQRPPCSSPPLPACRCPPVPRGFPALRGQARRLGDGSPDQVSLRSGRAVLRRQRVDPEVFDLYGFSTMTRRHWLPEQCQRSGPPCPASYFR